jgi:hypothetical protein
MASDAEQHNNRPTNPGSASGRFPRASDRESELAVIKNLQNNRIKEILIYMITQRKGAKAQRKLILRQDEQSRASLRITNTKTSASPRLCVKNSFNQTFLKINFLPSLSDHGAHYSLIPTRHRHGETDITLPPS